MFISTLDPVNSNLIYLITYLTCSLAGSIDTNRFSPRDFWFVFS